MRRLFYLLDNLIKTASTSHSVSRFHSAVLKAGKSNSSRKSLEIKLHHRQASGKVTVDVYEYTKSGHKHRRYELENISKPMFAKLEKMISSGSWGMFFAVVNKHRIKED